MLLQKKLDEESVNNPILMLSYYFIPDGGAGVLRFLRFVKYLPQFGWEPIVLTVNKSDYSKKDPGLIKYLNKNTIVAKTYCFNYKDLVSKIINSLSKKKRAVSVSEKSGRNEHEDSEDKIGVKRYQEKGCI